MRAKPRHVVWIDHRAKIVDYQKRGGDYLVWARIFEKHAEEHRPTGPDTGSACNSCAEEWPCPIIAGDLSRYD